MERIDELLKKLDSLPDGYISKKTIKGKVYSYLQYFEEGKIVSKYVPNDKLANLEKKLALRKEIEAEVKELSASYIPMPPVTKREMELTGTIMCGDLVAAKIYKGEVTWFDEKIAPFFLMRSKDAKAFFASRCVDLTRANARALLYSLQIKDNDEFVIPLYVNGRMLTDNYWFRPSGAVTKFEELDFGKNLYGAASLKGVKKVYPIGTCRTPEIVTPGNSEKCWKDEDGVWYLYKKETDTEIFSELFTTNLAKELGINTVEYCRDGDCLKCKNFADKYNFDPISGIIDNPDDLIGTYNSLKKFGKSVLKDYIKIRYLDALVYNVDRTGNDMGLLRDKITGEVISMAPNFDNNCTLEAILPRYDIEASHDPVVSAFVKFVRSNKEIKYLFKKCRLPKVKRDLIKKTILKIDINKENYRTIREFVHSRYSYIKHHI